MVLLSEEYPLALRLQNWGKRDAEVGSCVFSLLVFKASSHTLEDLNDLISQPFQAHRSIEVVFHVSLLVLVLL